MDEDYMDEDYIKYCIHCGWNDCDFGCVCPIHEKVYQCPLYMHYHPEEVEEFEKCFKEWAKNNGN